MAETPRLDNYEDHPRMVGWFDPGMLIDIARQAIVSGLFGQYADRRLLQAALDPADPVELMRRAAATANVGRDDEGAVWIDYVADLGDGFDSTYAIAYMLGQEKLEVEGKALPRGQLLVMGGDQVYPAATRNEYRRRMRRPYAYAFPDSRVPDAKHPPLLLIPGNHDWYDGLTLFLALFCTNREKRIGSWRAIQRRSYFAQQLPDNWWIWAFDSQLGEDIDQPQADYFVDIARAMPADAKIILCAPVPTWIYGETKAKDSEEKQKFFRGLDYVALDIIKANCKNARIVAVLSGDTHHYSRYSADDGTQFITAGGGGAFLHPTHQLPPKIPITWMGQERTLSLFTEPGTDHESSETEACYPSFAQSRKLLFRNLFFAPMNWRFSITLGFIYWVLAQVFIVALDPIRVPDDRFYSWSEKIVAAVVASPVFLVMALSLWAILSLYADAKSKIGKAFLGLLHAIPHGALIVFLISIFVPLNSICAGASPSAIFGISSYVI